MRKTACLAGIFAAGAGILAGGAPAFADSADNDGINIGNDNNLSVLPIQLCGNNIAVLGAVVPVLSPQANTCVNAPIVDHPGGGYKPTPTVPTEPCKAGESKPGWAAQSKPGWFKPGEEMPGWFSAGGSDPCGPGGPGGPGGPNVPGGPGAPTTSDKAVSAANPLPTAPTPDPVRGHHAVTG
ncbi:hypothetical protein [Saccharopolyspora phatthalungensis]|uniref:Chaplin domain-containing protein n=1 Tax=Saccharopolyspora phatthalungensis TaxID=664693 RepID=A0A840PV08_9PSEU|nr:hypothetical protein [Saccharopolyspora phatthalungensis]MBB5154122.1 hypothetical protein [Saccharopolyspora phatthalungensis]